MNSSEVKYCILCGSATRMDEKFGRMRPVCSDCGWTYFTDPKVAVGVVVQKRGKVLLTRRINEPFQGYWSLPAGFMDAGEIPEDAAIRECLEETGLKIKITGLLDLVAGREHKNGADIVIVYTAEILSGNLIAGDDADQVEFFPLNQLPPLAFKATSQTLLKIQNFS